ncbi:DUF4149 domain-containing protein [Belnapia rosea]|uniref:TMEM205-like domain-containing protein n=1 Tax=Belnapia rosea TaxID=938405 RepID=A0A1G7CAN7_9PROT|nr:DUF4149 domain-containing protein [Belnapia rosea]SDE36389.1 protein of unknown function [Belnapia rosea]
MILSALSLLSLALLLGGMVFFAAVVAPLVFTRLPADQAGRFIRQLFPVYYLWLIATAGLAALALAPARPADALAMALVAALTLWLRQGLMPRINRLSDAAQAGDAAARPRFDRAHRLSVLLNLAQMLVAAAVLLRQAWPPP